VRSFPNAASSASRQHNLLLCPPSGSRRFAATSPATPTLCRRENVGAGRGDPPTRIGAARRLGGQDDGPDRSLAQGDPAENFTPRVPCPSEMLGATGELAVRMAPRTLAVARGPLPRAFGAPIGVAERPTRSEAVSTRGRSTRRVTFASAHQRDLGSTSSMSAAIAPSAAKAAEGDSG